MRRSVQAGVCSLCCHVIIPRRHVLVSFLVQCILLFLTIRVHIRPARAVVYCCVGFATVLPSVLCLTLPRTPVNSIPMCGLLGVVLAGVYESMFTVFNKKHEDDDVIDL
jgi:hypothetical protein